MVAHKRTTMVGLPLNMQDVEALGERLKEESITRLELLLQQCLICGSLSGLNDIVRNLLMYCTTPYQGSNSKTGL